MTHDYYFYRARYYEPGVGRFTQRDPIGGIEQLYAYTYNDPISNVDPFGLYPPGTVVCRSNGKADDVAIVIAEGATRGPLDDIIAGYGALGTDPQTKCALGQKFWGRRNGPKDLWSGYDQDFNHYASNISLEKIYDRYHDWKTNEDQKCFQKPFQCSDFVGYLLTGKKSGHESTTSLCGRK